MGNALPRELIPNSEASLPSLAGRYLGLYGTHPNSISLKQNYDPQEVIAYLWTAPDPSISRPHGFELIEISVSNDKICAKKLTGDPNVPAGECTFEVEADGTARGRVAETGFINPLWIPGWLEWDGDDLDEFSFHFEGCGSVSYIRVSPNFELTDQSLRTFIAHNYTRLAYAHGMWWILPKHQRSASTVALDSLQLCRLSESTRQQAQRCTICLFDFELGEEATILPCRHVYHPDCARKWLSRCNSCPLCKKPLPQIANSDATSPADPTHATIVSPS